MNIALLGAGTVGGSLLETLSRDCDRTAAINGSPITVTKVLERDQSKHEWIRSFGASVARDLDELLADRSIEAVVELIGRIDPAREYVARALESGKHVVTCNKDLISEHFDELMGIASSHNVALLFEGSVCGAIPILRSLIASLRANHIEEIAGIVNGTTNYILSRMAESGGSFQEGLAEAQRLGYAESDPAADVSGLDAARKICILARIAFGVPLRPGFISVEGIEGVSAEDVAAAKAAGMTLKLIASAVRREIGGESFVSARVSPALLPSNHRLAQVADSFNAVEITGHPMDTLFFMGRGAGGMPTASAVVADLLEIQRSRESAAALACGLPRTSRLLPAERMESRWFVYSSPSRGSRGRAGDLGAALRGHGVPLDDTQPNPRSQAWSAVTTGRVVDSAFLAALARLRLSSLQSVRAVRLYP